MLDVDWRVGLGPESDQDEAEPLGDRYRTQPELTAIERLKRVACERLSEKVAVQVIRPRVIRALERTSGTTRVR